MALEYKYTPVIARESKRPIIFTSMHHTPAEKRRGKTNNSTWKGTHAPLKRIKWLDNDIEGKTGVWRMKEERGREERKGCSLIQLAALA